MCYLGAQSMRHSRSMPEEASSSRRLSNKWPSINTDSGISLFSADTLKSRDLKYVLYHLFFCYILLKTIFIFYIISSRSRSMGMNTPSSTSSTSFQLEEARRRLEDETRR